MKKNPWKITVYSVGPAHAAPVEVTLITERRGVNEMTFIDLTPKQAKQLVRRLKRAIKAR